MVINVFIISSQNTEKPEIDLVIHGKCKTFGMSVLKGECQRVVSASLLNST